MTTPNLHQDHGEGGEEHPAAESPVPRTPASETAEARRSRLIGQGVALGTGLGASFGMMLGLFVFDNFVFGLPIGLGVGIAVGVVAGSRRAAAAERAEVGGGPSQPETGPTR